MKLVSFVTAAGLPSYGAVRGDALVELGSRLGPAGAPSLRTLLASGQIAQARQLAAEAPAELPLAGLQFLPVIPDPGKIVCVGLNYRDHVAETGRTVTEKPALFARYPVSQVGHLQPLVKPAVSDHFDFEGELAVIIGQAGRHIGEDRALHHVAGYACYNEGSIRDWQRHTSQFLAGKSFAQSGSFGPWMVTADEIPAPSRLVLETRLNDVVVQHTTTDLMITPIPGLIAYISTIFPLEPGDVIVTGTPGGVGARRTPPLWMRPGDRVEVEISDIGVLRNSVIAEAA
jgi:2-keto-4-pentenoate hydratase/2-oxohepta-3-ene-1,7-dioic acid hydratase in catechol pathway